MPCPIETRSSARCSPWPVGFPPCPAHCNDSGKIKADSQGVSLSLCLVEALDQLWTKTPAFSGPESALDSARATESTRFMVGAVGIELLNKFTKSHVITVLPTSSQMNWS